MKTTWLEDWLPQAAASPRMQIWWILFFALFPLAYAGGIELALWQERAARIEGAEDRAASIRTAAQFAESKGFSVTGWHRYATVETRDDLIVYYASQRNAAAGALALLAPAREVQVLFRSGDQSYEFRVYLSLTGRVTGYDFGNSTDRKKSFSNDVGVIRVQSDSTDDSAKAAAPSEDANAARERHAEAVARAALAQNPQLGKLVPLGADTGKLKIDRNGDDPSRYDLVWDASPASFPGLTLHITESVRGEQVVAQHVEATVDKGHSVEKSKLKTSLSVVNGFFLAFGAFYAMYRYAKRTLQKEVSHARTLVVAGLFAACFSVFMYSLWVDQIATRLSGATFGKVQTAIYVSAAVVVVILGLLVGIGYGSGEGELREAYPGKLTSLDALLSGRVLSRDVAFSLLFGAAAAGWLVLTQQSLSYLMRGDSEAMRNQALHFMYAHYPRLSLVVGRQYDSLLIAVAGLLLPASFLARPTFRRHRRFLWLVVFALLAVLVDAAQASTPALVALSAIMLASALLLPFFAFDLLAAMVSLSAMGFVNEVVRLVEVVPSWSAFALFLAGVGAAALALAALLLWRGQNVREDDVRPRYARNLAERIAMQAEILTAREAQLRLLPQAAPELPGVQMAAFCLPARGVGGDFYDFFQLDANRVGIFVAQGGGEGLASALCIALAKGLLMHASQQAHSPTEIIRGLDASIAELLERGSGTGISFAYGVMDTRLNLLKYARIGKSPRVMIYREGAGLAPSPLEREVGEPARLTNGPAIYEGVAQAHPGDFIIFVTNGVMALRGGRFGKRNSEGLPGFVRELGKPEDPLQKSLEAVFAKYRKHASEDLTAVVLRVTAADVLRQEIVA